MSRPLISVRRRISSMPLWRHGNQSRNQSRTLKTGLPRVARDGQKWSTHERSVAPAVRFELTTKRGGQCAVLLSVEHRPKPPLLVAQFQPPDEANL